MQRLSPRPHSSTSVHHGFSLYRFENGIILERALVFTPRFAGRVDFGLWPQLRDAGYAGMAERAVRSLRP